MNIKREVVSFGFNVHKRVEIRQMIRGTLKEFIGPSFEEEDWELEVEVQMSGYRDHAKIWNVNVTAGYAGG